MPSDTGPVKTRMAVAAYLRKVVWNACQGGYGVDWFTPGTAMRLYLDRLHWALGSIRYILEALFNLQEFDYGEFSHGNYIGPWRGALKRTLWNDLVVAIYGRGMDRQILGNLLAGRYFENDPSDEAIYTKSCGLCEELFLPGFLYSSEHRFCIGCELDWGLTYQRENFHFEKRKVVNQLLLAGEYGLHDILNEKRLATNRELADINFPFWKLSVKTRQEVLDACNGNTTALTLDGRPGATLPEDYKEIWLWKESLVRATSYAARHIDKGIGRGRQKIRRYEEKRHQLQNDNRHGASQNGRKRRQNLAKIQELDSQIEKEKARCGLAQMCDSHRQGPQLRPDWMTGIDAYAQKVKSIDSIRQGHNDGSLSEGRDSGNN